MTDQPNDPPPYRNLPVTPTGFTNLDQLVELRPGSLNVVTGLSGVGKSAFALSIARHVTVILDQPALYFSPEMSSGELTMQFLAAEARVTHNRLAQEDRLDEGDWARLAKVIGSMPMPGQLRMDDKGTITPSYLRSVLEQSSTEFRLVIVDYIQLMEPDHLTGRHDHDVAQVARKLKQLARDFSVPLLVVSQANDLPSSVSSKTPTTHDVTGSQAIAQHADLVITLARPDLLDEYSMRAGEIDVSVVKNRHGRTGSFVMAF